MKPVALKMKYALAFLIAGVLAAAPSLADKGGKHKGEGHGNKHSDARGDRPHFEDRHQVIVREYYATQFQRGRCPPGLAKKGNGCMPPGQAKKWQVGRPLARDVIYYPVPQALVIQIGVPPPGHRYVRVAADILLIAVGTGMVVDAIQDLSR